MLVPQPIPEGADARRIVAGIMGGGARSGTR
jgi:hypothetical protein